MTLDEKRAVVMALLCCSDERSPDTTNTTADDLGISGANPARSSADKKWNAAYDDLGGALHHVASTEAAYRLIESSATLRREFFASTAHVPVGGTGP